MRRCRAASAVLIEDLIDGADHAGHLHVDSEGLLVERNSGALRLLNSEWGLRERSGRLTSADPGDDEALERLLAKASKGAGPGSVAIGTPAGRRLVVHVVPVVNGSAGAGRAARPRAAACVVLVDPWSEISLNPEVLTEALGLTRAQSQVVAGLVRGMTVREIAEATERAHGSVRWHVKRALERTGSRRQSDLVRMAIVATSLPRRDRGAAGSSCFCLAGNS